MDRPDNYPRDMTDSEIILAVFGKAWVWENLEREGPGNDVWARGFRNIFLIALVYRFKDVDCVNRDQNQVQAMNQIRNPHPREDDHIEAEEAGG